MDDPKPSKTDLPKVPDLEAVNSINETEKQEIIELVSQDQHQQTKRKNSKPRNLTTRRETILYTESKSKMIKSNHNLCNFPVKNVDLLHTKRKLVSLKNFRDVYTQKALDKFLKESTIIMNEKELDINEILDNLIYEILSKASNVKIDEKELIPVFAKARRGSQMIRDSLGNVGKKIFPIMEEGTSSSNQNQTADSKNTSATDALSLSQQVQETRAGLFTMRDDILENNGLIEWITKNGDIHLLNETLQACSISDEGNFHYQHTWIVTIGNCPYVDTQQVGISKLSHGINLGKHAREVRFIILVLCPTKNESGGHFANSLESGLNTAAVFGTLFADITLHQKLLQAKTVKSIHDLLVDERKKITEIYKEMLNKHNLKKQAEKGTLSYAFNKAKTQALSPKPSNNHNINSDQIADLDKIVISDDPQNLPKSIRKFSKEEVVDESAFAIRHSDSILTNFDGEEIDFHGDYALCEVGKGIKDDVVRRAPYFLDDWVDVLKDEDSIQTVFTATIFIYLACLLPTIGFGNVNHLTTNGFLTIRKGIFAQAAGGIFFSIFSTQPLLILLTTAPITLYVHIIKDLAVTLNFDFQQLYTHVGIWCSVFVAIYALTNSAKFMKFSTRATDEIFMMFTAFAFFFEAFKHIEHSYKCHYLNEEEYNNYNSTASYLNQTVRTNFGPLITPDLFSTKNLEFKLPRAAAADDYCAGNDGGKDIFLLYLILVASTVWMSLTMYNFKMSPFLNLKLRESFSDYALPATVVIISLINYIYFKGVNLEKIELTDSNEIQIHQFKNDQWSFGFFFVSSSLGFCLSLLFYMDQGFAAALTNSANNNLEKPFGYHHDLFLIAIINFVFSLFGLPWIHGAVPHSPLHARALAKVEVSVEDGHISEDIAYIQEQRVSSFVSHILIAVSMSFIALLRFIPLPVLDGVFIFIAIQSLYGNQMIERLLLLIKDRAAYPPHHYLRKVPIKNVHLFTVIQLIQLLFLIFIAFYTFSALELIFPVLVLFLIPIREFLLPKMISRYHLDIMDRHC